VSLSLAIRLFGRPEVRTGSSPSPLRVQARAMSLLAYLLVHRERPLPREAVAFTFWPDLAEDDARSKLRWYLHYLRNEALPKAENGEWILADKRTLQWNPCGATWLDVAEFERLSSRAAGVAEAVDLYGGDLMSGFDDEWLEAPRAHLRERQTALLLALIEECRRKNDYAAAIEYAQRLLAVDPWREDAVAALVDLRREGGDRAGALATYREFAGRLQMELGVTPSGETKAAYERALSSEIRVNLPHETTSFIDREAELAQAQALLAASRLLTLAGTGGVGKTRLAIALARSVAPSFPDGVWFVDLAAVSDPLFVAPTLLAALGLREQPGREGGDVAAEWLRKRTVLLVFDNCEHVVAEAARLAVELLHRCANVRIVATSREVLDVEGEALFRIPPFAEEEGVALFASRATALVPAFLVNASNADAIKRICKRLDGIPLAIELAAARIKMMTVEQLAARLDDRFRILTGGSRTALPRQQTLRGSIGWSVALLSSDEKVLLRRLTIFAGNFPLEAIAHVASYDPIDTAAIVDLLASLIDKSLVQTEAHRSEQQYRLLESTKEYALEMLADSGEAQALRDRHAAYFAALADEAERHAGTGEYKAFRTRIAQSYGEFRAVLQWALAGRDDAELGARLAAALGRYWHERGQWREGRHWLELVLALDDGEISTRTRASALFSLARQYYAQGEYSAMAEAATTATELFVAVGDVTGAAWARNLVAFAAFYAGRFAETQGLYQETLHTARAIGDRRMEAISLNNLAEVRADWKREYAAAEELYAQAVAIHRERGDAWILGTTLGDWSRTAAYQGAYDRAQRLAEEALAVCREIGDETRIVEQLFLLGHYRVLAGAPDAAREVLLEAVERLRASMHPLYVARCADACADYAAACERFADASALYGFSDAWRAAKRLPRPPPAQEQYSAAVASLRGRLDGNAFDAAVERGTRCDASVALGLCEAITQKA
jgi:non-specific serine/threonine protein kinase